MHGGGFPPPSLLVGTLPEGFHSPPWVRTALHGATGRPDPEFRHVQRRGEPGSPWFRWPPTAVPRGMAVGHFARLQSPERCMGWARGTKALKPQGCSSECPHCCIISIGGPRTRWGGPTLSELQESLPGPLCGSWGPPQWGKKPERKAVNGAWKRAKHRHPAREIGGKRMPKETTLGHSRQPGCGTGWAELKSCRSRSAFLLFCVLCAVAGLPVPALLHRWSSQEVPPESCLGVNHSHSSPSSKPD